MNFRTQVNSYPDLIGFENLSGLQDGRNSVFHKISCLAITNSGKVWYYKAIKMDKANRKLILPPVTPFALKLV
jgi:hypothetical protein